MRFRIGWLSLLALLACSTSAENGTGGGTTTGSGGGGGAGPRCETPTPFDSVSGLVRCADGAIDRASAGSCTPGVVGPACEGTEMQLICTSDADCTAHPYGRCTSSFQGGGGGTTFCACEYSCVTDADCDPGSACACAGAGEWIQGSRCITALCVTNADCPSGECGVSSFDNGCEVERYFVCRTSEDTCHADSDCTAPGQTCVRYGDVWACRQFDCTF